MIKHTTDSTSVKLTPAQRKALIDFAQSDPANGKFASCALTTARALRNKGLLELNADRRCVITDLGRLALAPASEPATPDPVAQTSTDDPTLVLSVHPESGQVVWRKPEPLVHFVPEPESSPTTDFIRSLANLRIEDMSPLDCMTKLHEIKREAKRLSEAK